MRGFNAAVRAALMPRFVYRMRFLAFSIVQNTTTILPLMSVPQDNDPDYDQLIDGTNPAECSPGSRIIALQLHFQFVPGATPGDLSGEICEWVLLKDPDGALSAAGGANMATLYTQDVTTLTKMIRKNAIAADQIVFSTNVDNPRMRINLSRKALRRIGPMQENDTLRIAFTMTPASANATLYGRGRIITRQA